MLKISSDCAPLNKRGPCLAARRHVVQTGENCVGCTGREVDKRQVRSRILTWDNPRTIDLSPPDSEPGFKNYTVKVG